MISVAKCGTVGVPRPTVPLKDSSNVQATQAHHSPVPRIGVFITKSYEKEHKSDCV